MLIFEKSLDRNNYCDAQFEIIKRLIFFFLSNGNYSKFILNKNAILA